MIPNRQFPTGVLQLLETVGEDKILIEEFTTSSKNRDRINQLKNQLLMLNPKRNLQVSENNAVKHTRP
jgi:hypothetical protein